MSTARWSITLQIYRKKGDEPSHFDEFKMEANPEEYVLDCIERVWAIHDRSLVYRHACHHSTCGACGMRVNGVEKLTCITPVNEVTHNGGVLRIEPLRNFPVVSDLAVDMGTLYTRMGMVEHRPVNSDAEEAIQPEARPAGPCEEAKIFLRLSDCIECGLCISACPICGSTPEYLGPAVLAGAQQHGIRSEQQLLKMVDGEDGIWRCHSAFECTAVCPSYVEPGWRIMDLRRQVIGEKIRGLFRGPRKEESDVKEAPGK